MQSRRKPRSIQPLTALAAAALVLALWLAIAIERPAARTPPSGGSGLAGQASPFDGDGMWIWIVAKSSGGDPDAIAAKAKASGIETVFVKSGDGTNYWSQFSPAFVSALKQRGLRVCAWQYVYGRRPAGEAAVSARAVINGADCFVIDAEAEYEGRYRSARTYVAKLRQRVGPNYPIGLAAFPYVNYHPAFPYSVFLGPGGAQFNLPQMYWRAIGVSVNTVYNVTYLYNRVYKRPIFPLGQVYMNPSGAELARFRGLARSNGSTGVSWWDWQEARARHWRALAREAPNGGTPPTVAYPLLKKGSRGDLVVWAQQHLRAAGFDLPVTGFYRTATASAVAAFRNSKGLAPGAVMDTAAWRELLKLTPATSRRAKATAAAPASVPASARLPAVRNELGLRRGR